ncbi:potassium-transporting ATPase subunit KdpA [Campylobacter jejuni]|uniref:potassium-transporting ATPase subunit KdpA n=1 Tax=Campylobacter jejuni TaxID=197 RepID=UPI002043B092|nr:potassium-transporting ATPase subunit KdpA [Campylobacter jejuni]
MIGRTPEFLGKKIESAQMKLIALVILIHPLLILVLSALAVVFAKDSIILAFMTWLKFCMNLVLRQQIMVQDLKV